MKNLKIIYQDQTLYEGEVSDFQFMESALGVSATGKLASAPEPQAVKKPTGNLIEALVSASANAKKNQASKHSAADDVIVHEAD